MNNNNSKGLTLSNDCNASSQIVTDCSKSNGSVTDRCNALPNGLKQFLKRSKSINEIERRPFSYIDFKNISKGNFRQIIRRLGNLIEVVHKGRPTFYKVKGIELPLDSHRVTQRPMGVAQNLIDILQTLKDQPAKIHDIKVKFSSNNLHSILVSKGITVNNSNSSVLVNVPYTDNNVILKALIYPDTIQIDIGCTYKPLVYDYSGILYLTQVLSFCSFYLGELTSFEAHIPNVSDWIITHYHFNKDGSQQLNGQSFHHTWEDVSSGLIRYYSKTMKDGSTIPRIEQIQTPDKTLNEIMIEVINK